MSKVRFVGLDVHAETAVAVAKPNGEVRSFCLIPNRPESIDGWFKNSNLWNNCGSVMKPVPRATCCTGS
jgi:hypothetical protein